MSDAMLRIGWFATARGTGSYNLLEATTRAIREGRLRASIAFVFCNREPGEAEPTDRFFDLVRANGIPLVTLSSVRFRRERDGERSRPDEPLPQWRWHYDHEVARLIAPYPFDVGMLAGYMLIVTSELTDRHPLLNLHPAAPGGPAGIWQDVIRQLIVAREKRSGVTIFRVTPEVDAGPPVAYCTYPIDDGELTPLWRKAVDVPPEKLEDTALFRAIRERGAARELPMVVATLRAFAEGERRFEGGRAVDAAGREAALDLTAEVEAAVAAMRGAASA